jgi:hypothetical protein
LPTLFGEGYGLYRRRGSTFVLSFTAHALAAALLVVSGQFVATHRHELHQQVVGLVADVSPYVLPASRSASGGGGGGGDRDKLPASKGVLPRFAREQLAPPAAVVRNDNPELAVEPTVVVPPEIRLSYPATGALGDPLSAVLGPPSNGTGSGGGIGSGNAAESARAAVLASDRDGAGASAAARITSEAECQLRVPCTHPTPSFPTKPAKRSTRARSSCG